MLIALLLGACTTGSPTAHTASPGPSPSATAVPSPSPTPTPIPEQAEAPLPLPRQEVAEGAVMGSLWVVGGFDPQRRSSNTVQVSKGAWAAGPAYPFPVDHAAAATSDERLYVAGGYSNGVPRADLYRVNSSQDGWERLAAMRHPRGALVLVALGSTLYAIGGAAGGEVAPVEAYDTIQNVWTDAGSLPLPRDHGAGFAWQGLACIAGGRFPTMSRVDCYDPMSGAWSRLPDLPSPTSGAGAVGLGGQAIVAGGENAVESTLVGHVFRFAGGTAWTDEPMLIPRHGIQLAIWGGRAWACGGATAAGYQAATDCTSIG